MRIGICDDETAQQQMLKEYLEEWARQNKIMLETELFPDGESFLFTWEDGRVYDLLIFDIEMGQMNGVELAARIRRKDDEVPILFVTCHDKYMLQGFEVSALHYLLKPVSREKLFEVMDKLRMKQKREEKILFQMENGPISLAISKIWYIEAMAHHSILYTEDEEYALRASLGEVMQRLGDRKEFVRCHRSYLVNIQHIAAIRKPELILDDKRRLPLSRSAEKEVSRLFITMYKSI